MDVTCIFRRIIWNRKFSSPKFNVWSNNSNGWGWLLGWTFIDTCGCKKILIIQFFYYIPEKFPYTLPLERSCNKSLYLNDGLSLIALWPRPSFSANIKGACVLCLHNSTVCLGCVTKVPGRCYICPTGTKRKTMGTLGEMLTVLKWSFLVKNTT